MRSGTLVPAAAAALLLVAGCGTATSAPPANYSGKTLNLGAMVSVTGDGAAYGVQQMQAIQLAVDTVNQVGINGGRISVDLRDDQSDKDRSVQLATTLINDKHELGLIGPTLAISAAGVHPLTQRLKTPVLATSLTGRHIVGDCAYAAGCGYIFRDSLGEAIAIADNVKSAATKFHPHSAVIIYASDFTGSLDAAATFRQAFADNGISVPAGGLLTFSKHDTDFKKVVAAAKALKADLWAVSGLGQNPAKLIVEARAAGYTGPIAGDDSLNSIGVSKEAGKSGLGAQSGSGYWVGHEDAANSTFVEAFKARFKDADGKPKVPDELAAQAYTAVLLFAEAARHANLTFSDVNHDRDALRAALEHVDIATPLGQFSFTSQHDVHQTVWINALDGSGSFTNVATFPAG